MPGDIAPYDFRQRTPIVLATQMTKAEYVLLPESSIPHNLIAGTLYRSACPTFAHQEAVAAVAGALVGRQRRGAGEVILSPCDCHLSDDTIVQPDLGFVVAERAGILRDYVMGPPDL